jgi:hypothetical protein
MAGRFQMGRGPSARTRKGAKSHRMSELPAKRCATCEFYLGDYSSSRLDAVGYCVRFPPMFQREPGRCAESPMVPNNFRCGEWRPTTEPSQ